jgi:hypothetical protein
MKRVVIAISYFATFLLLLLFRIVNRFGLSVIICGANCYLIDTETGLIFIGAFYYLLSDLVIDPFYGSLFYGFLSLFRAIK